MRSWERFVNCIQHSVDHVARFFGVRVLFFVPWPPRLCHVYFNMCFARIVAILLSFFVLFATPGCDFLWTHHDDGDSEENGETGLDPDRILASYPFDGNAKDDSGNENHGTMTGVAPTTDRFGNAGGALDFDGAQSYVFVPHSESLDLGAPESRYSVAVWVRSLVPQASRIISKWSENTRHTYPFSLLVQVSSHHIRGQIRDESQYYVAEIADVLNGGWHHIVYTYDVPAGRIRGFLNGEPATEASFPAGASTNNEIALYIGAGPFVSRFFRGQLDDILIVRGTLSDEEVRSLYHEGGWGK